MFSSIYLLKEWLFSLGFNALLIAVAQFVPLLTSRGWIHAGALGTILFACLGWRGWLSVVCYLILGSLVTRLGYLRKQQAGLAESRGGRRGPENLWGSAAVGAFIAILIELDFGSKDLLLIGFAASFAAKLADTFGSEIGKRWGSRAVLITSLNPVAPGTDGAISLEGTVASAFGSILMTVVMVCLSLVPIGLPAFLVAFVGLLSTLIESVFGALYQNRFSWMTNELVNFLQTAIAALIGIFLAMSLI